MKSFFQVSLVSMLLLILLATSCTKEDLDITEAVDLPIIIDTVQVADPIALTVSSTAKSSVVNGGAYYGINGDSRLYSLASDNVTVECPGGLATSYNGGEPGEEYFNFQFFVSPTIEYVTLASFNTEIDGELKWLNVTIPPPCINAPLEVEYEIVNDRISGTITGEFFYPNPVYVPPFENCDNFISVGIVDVSFDLPLTKCFEL